MARASDDDEADRERIENALAALARARLVLELAWGRVSRSGDDLPADLLEALGSDLAEARCAIERAQGYIGGQWRAWQRARGYHSED